MARKNGPRIRKQKASLAHRRGWHQLMALRALWPTASRPPRWEGSLLDDSVKPGRLRQTTMRCSRGGWAVRTSNHGPLNPRAQCNQEEKICQEANDPKSAKSCCLVFKPSIPSGPVSRKHNRRGGRRGSEILFARPKTLTWLLCAKQNISAEFFRGAGLADALS